MNDLKFKIVTKIVKKSNGEPIPQNEPIFFLRARDNLAIKVLNFYKSLCLSENCTSYQIDGIDRVIEKFENFAEKYPRKMKQPGITRGA